MLKAGCGGALLVSSTFPRSGTKESGGHSLTPIP